jgi:phosphate starvation-inducible protein PhoH and related proteins
MFYVLLMGLCLIDGIDCINYMTGCGLRRDLQMRAKRNRLADDFVAVGSKDVVAGLAAGGGGSSNSRAISPVYTPRTLNQKTYVQYLEEQSTKIVLGVGAAGSGKTLFACYTAIQELRRGTISKIIMTRPVVPVEEEEIGFLPGSLINKMDPWTRPIFDILLEFYAQKDIDAMLHGGVIEISPLAFMRGRTFKRAFIIADEMQNSSPNQMLMLTTRLGEGSKMVITGDLKQSDRGMDNGLADLLRKLKVYEKGHSAGTGNSSHTGSLNQDIKYVELESADVQRSAIVSKILDIYGGATAADDGFSRKTGGEPEKIVDMKKKDSLFTENNNNYDFTNNNNNNDDAALIPRQHMSKYMRK